MGDSSREWKDGRYKDITFIVTKDCQLACKYCYLVGKNANERMSWETAKKAVDFVLANDFDDDFASENVVFNFIGGEPFLEIDLIDRICEYLKEQMYLLNHRWFNSYMFSITTNGINYNDPKVQKFIHNNIQRLSVTITIDGTERKHNLNRVWKDKDDDGLKGRGSYDAVVGNIPLWLDEFPDASTKVTISSADLPYVCESVLHLFSLGIYTVHINCVFENVWQEGDDVLLEKQMMLLADKMIENRLFDDYDCSLFNQEIGHPLSINNDRNWCGAGLMLAIDASGNLYPCTRFVKYALRDKLPRIIGNLDNGIDRNLLRPFQNLSRSIQSTKECIECEVASGCAWCQGENYDCSASGTIFQRSTAICKMHKARVRANNYYWSKVRQAKREQLKVMSKVNNKCSIDKEIIGPNTLIVLLASDSTSYCMVDNRPKDSFLLPIGILEKAIHQSMVRNWGLQFVYPDYPLPPEYMSLINSVSHKDIVPRSSMREGDCIVINHWTDIEQNTIDDSFYLLRTTFADFYEKSDCLDALLEKCQRLNVVFVDEFSYSEADEPLYYAALEKLARKTFQQWKQNHKVEVNLITDRLHLTEMCNCNAGWKSVTLAPNGKYYICPSFYYENESQNCGDIDGGLEIMNPLLYSLSHAPLCSSCGAYHCQRCVYLNQKKTLEVNIPSYEQCAKSRIELDATKMFYNLLIKS